MVKSTRCDGGATRKAARTPLSASSGAAWTIDSAPSEWPTRTIGRSVLLACSAIRATQLSKFGSCQSVCSMRRAVESFCSQRVYQWLELPPPRPGAMRMSRSDVFSGFAFQRMM
jgi:hypothetical protein